MFDIKAYFTPESQNTDGSITTLSGPGEGRKTFYLTNSHNNKLLKIVIKGEPNRQKKETYAQIKIIGYGIKRARVWEDKLGDPRIVSLPDIVEMTYHGAQKGEANSKVHIKAHSGYKTLVDDSLQLPASADVPLPLFAIDPGYKNQEKSGNTIKKNAHIVSTGNQDYVRVDFYLASTNMDIGAFFNSIYFFNLFWTQEYLAAARNHPLESGEIIAPIAIVRISDYLLFVRRSVSLHRGQPYLSFYSNKEYYNKLMNRRVAYRESDGLMHWSTMAEEEERLRRTLNGIPKIGQMGKL